MFEAENGNWTWLRRHNPIANTGGGVDWGFCGTNDKYNGHIVEDPRFHTDQEWQMQQCLAMWKKGTPFYGFLDKRRFEKAKKNISFLKKP